MAPLRRPRIVLALVIGLIIGSILPLTELPGTGGTPSASGPPVTPPPSNATVAEGAVLGHHLASPFIAAVFTASTPSTAVMAAVGSFFNTTPITWFRFGGNGEAYDPTTQTLYVPPAGGGTYVPTSDQLWNFTWFKSWCESRTPRCAWLGYLPGELNDTSAAVHAAQWYHEVLGFVPTEWQLSNEPELWNHYGENFTQWSTTDNSTPTGPAYATMAREYVNAVHALYPSDQFVGIEAACATCDPSRVIDTARAVGPGLAALAYHSYPTAPTSTSDLGAFYGTLAGSQGIPATVAGFRSLYAAVCGTCQALPAQIGEYQAGPPTGFSPFAAGYPGAVFLGASVIEALQANVSTFTVFNSISLFYATSHAPTPEGLLYQRILANLTMGDDIAVTLGPGAPSGTYALLIQNGSRESFLVVNTNLTSDLTLTFPASGFPIGGVGSEWTWSPATALPLAHRAIYLPSSYDVPPQGILLLNNF